MEHEKHPRNVNSFVFDGDGIDIIVTNKSRQSQRLIPDCSLVGLGVGGWRLRTGSMMVYGPSALDSGPNRQENQ